MILLFFLKKLLEFAEEDWLKFITAMQVKSEDSWVTLKSW